LSHAESRLATMAASPPSITEAGRLSWSIFALARVHRARAAELLRELGLHPGQELLLMQLFDRDGQSQSELLQAVGLDHSTVSKSLSRMQEAGLVSRAPSGHDRRVQLVTLTERGRALRAPIERVWAQLEEVSVHGLDSEDVERFVATAVAIQTKLQASSEAQSDRSTRTRSA
jgi:DNA-binding MarR family transcriptional regulator